MALAVARAHPAFVADHHGHRLVDHFDFEHGFFVGLNQSAARVGKDFGVGLDFFDHEAAQRGRAAEDFFELALLFAQAAELLLDLDGFKPGELAQANLKNVFSLALAELEALDQRGLGLFGLADDGNHFVDIEQHQLPAFEDVDAREHFVEPVLRAPLDGGLPEGDPLTEHLPE